MKMPFDTRLMRMERAAPRMLAMLRDLIEKQPYHRLAHEARQIINEVDGNDEATKKLREIIFSNLQSALDNDYDFLDWTAEEIARDLIAYAEDCEKHSVADLIPHIEEWRKTQ